MSLPIAARNKPIPAVAPPAVSDTPQAPTGATTQPKPGALAFVPFEPQAQSKLVEAKRVLAENQAIWKQNPLKPGQLEIVQAKQADVATLQGKVNVLTRAQGAGAKAQANANANANPRMSVPHGRQLIGADGTGKPQGEVLFKRQYDSFGRGLEADDGFMGTGLGKKRDNTHQLVQRERVGKDGKKTWEVYVQPTGEGRINANLHVFSSNRKLTASDFNKASKLGGNYREGVKTLNADSNRLPEPAPKAAVARPASNRWWIEQHLRDSYASLGSAGNAFISAVGSLPENAVKAGSSLGNTARTTANLLTGGRVGENAFNPIATEEHYRYYNAPTNFAKLAQAAQRRTNAAFDADPDSLSYKAGSVAGSVAITAFAGKAAGEMGAAPRVTSAGASQRLLKPRGASSVDLSLPLKPGGKSLAHPQENLKQAVQAHKQGRIGDNQLKPGGKPSTHPIENLKQAVHAHKQGTISDTQLNHAMARAAEAFKAQQKVSSNGWTNEMKGEFVKYGAEVNNRLGGGHKAGS